MRPQCLHLDLRTLVRFLALGVEETLVGKTVTPDGVGMTPCLGKGGEAKEVVEGDPKTKVAGLKGVPSTNPRPFLLEAGL